MSSRDLPRLVPGPRDEALLDKILACAQPGPVDDAPQLLEGPHLFLALYAELANLGAPQGVLDDVDAAAERDFTTGLEQLQRLVLDAEARFDRWSARAAGDLAEIERLEGSQRRSKEVLRVFCDDAVRHTLAVVYQARSGLLIHLKGDSRLVRSTVFDFGRDVTDVRLVKHRGAFVDWDVNPAAYWCTTGCACSSPVSIDFARVRAAIAARHRTARLSHVGGDRIPPSQ